MAHYVRLEKLDILSRFKLVYRKQKSHKLTSWGTGCLSTIIYNGF